MPSPAAFYFDLASPLAYLAAEQVLHALPRPAEWQPILAAELPKQAKLAGYLGEQPRKARHEEIPERKESAEHEEISEREESAERDAISRRAEELGLQPLRWPDPFPFDSALAMRVATYAKSIGRTVPFAQAAFRQAFAGGRSLADENSVLIAAAACEMHPKAVLKGAALQSVADQLSTATAAAGQAGVSAVPALLVDGRIFQGPLALDRAAAHMRSETIPLAAR